MADGLLKGWAFGRGVMDDAFAAKRTGKLAALASQAYGAEPTQRSGLVQQAIGVDPNAGFALGKQLGQDDDARNERLGMMARVLTSVPEDARPGLYRQMVPELSRFGLSSLPPEYTPEVGQIAQQLADALGGAGPGNNVQSRFVDQQGNVMALMRDGTVRPLGVQAENRLQIRDQPGVPLGAFDPRSGTIRGVQEAGAQQPQQQMAPGEVPFSIDPGLPPAVQAAIRANPQQFASMGDGQSVTVPGVMPSQSGVAASRPDTSQLISPYQQAQLDLQRDKLAAAQTARDQATAARKDAADAKAAAQSQAAGARQAESATSAGELISAIDALTKHEGFKSLGTALGDIQINAPLVRNAAKDANAQLKNIGGQVALATMNRLKALSSQGATGFGALSQGELTLLQNSIAALNSEDISNDQIQASLKVIRDKMQKITDWKGGASSADGRAPLPSGFSWED